jgi:hypothetical protein
MLTPLCRRFVPPPRRRYISGGMSIAALLSWLVHRAWNRFRPWSQKSSAEETPAEETPAEVSWHPPQPLWNRSTTNTDSPYAVPPGGGNALATTQLSQNTRASHKSEETLPSAYTTLTSSNLPSEPGTPAEDPLPYFVRGLLFASFPAPLYLPLYPRPVPLPLVSNREAAHDHTTCPEAHIHHSRMATLRSQSPEYTHAVADKGACFDGRVGVLGYISQVPTTMSCRPDLNLSSLLVVVRDQPTVPPFVARSPDLRRSHSDTVVSSTPSGNRVKDERFPSLGVAKWIASIHITTGTLYSRGACNPLYIYSWGHAWVPWLFVTSGFLLTHARLTLPADNKNGGMVMFVLRRLAKVMPLYMVAMLLSVLIRIMEGRMLPHLWILITQFILAQVRATKRLLTPTRPSPNLMLTPAQESASERQPWPWPADGFEVRPSMRPGHRTDHTPRARTATRYRRGCPSLRSPR